jgi:V8-like Glu-specific endopeptidase
MFRTRLAVALAATTALALAVPAANAKTESPGSSGSSDKAASGVAVHAAATTRAAHIRIVKYWTTARMRNAVPGDALVAGRDKSSATGRVAAGSPQVVGAKGKPGGGGGGFVGDYYTGGGAVVNTTGKVFFTLGGTNYVCSGSSTTSSNHDLVLTAGHCVNEGPGAYATNFAFVPAYDDGARPFGTFTARQLVTTTQWRTSGDFNYDVAFAVMNPLGGSDLTDTVGSQGIGFNLSRGQYMHSFGYPQASPYDGSDIAWCHGTAIQDSFGGSQDQGLKCNLTGGSSGGPWFTGYSTGTGVGTLNSLNSFKYRGGPLKSYMWGPYFGSVAQSLYNAAQVS